MDKLKTKVDQAKQFVKRHKTDAAFIAGAAVMYTIATVIYTLDVRGNEVVRGNIYPCMEDDCDALNLVLTKRNGSEKDMGWAPPVTKP